MPIPFNPHIVLGLTQNASEEDIRKAYRKHAMQFHPDKNGNATAEVRELASEQMKVLNRAYEILTKDSERTKWEAEHKEDTVEIINNVKIVTNVQRPSALYKCLFTELTQQFELKPLKALSTEDRHSAYSELKDLSKSESFGKFFYQHLYRVKGDNLEYPDVYQFVSHMSKWAESAVPIKPSFFKDNLTPIKAIALLQNFIRGEYYGDNLIAIKAYLVAEVARFQDVSIPLAAFYKSIATIINTTSIRKDYQQILNALQDIYSFYYSEGYTENANNELIQIMQDKHFRYFVASTYSHFWSSGDRVVNNALMLQIKSEYTRLKSVIPLGYYLLRIEEKMLTLFSQPQICVKEIYECAHLFIDLSESSLTSIGIVNSSILAALCYQVASHNEMEQSARMAAEFFALSLYQKAMQQAFNTTPIVTLYASTYIAKYMSELVYDQSTLSLETLSQFITQPGDAKLMIHTGSVEKTIQGAIKKALYILDIFPFYTSPKSTMDLELIETYQLGMMRSLLSSLLDQKSEPSQREYSKVVYHAYEDTLTKWCDEKNESQQLEKQAKLKLQAIELLLEQEGVLQSRMQKLIDQPYIHMQRDRDGWLVSNNELDFPDKAKVAIYKSFDGYEIDYETGTVTLLLKPWQGEDSRSLRLFSDFDILQMINLGIGGGFLSLDHVDADKRYHPLQAVRFSPDYLEGTEYLKTLFMTDYLLKMFTTGVEISAHPPYRTRAIDSLLQALPDHLRKILMLCRDNHHGKSRAHRFWITAEAIERQEHEVGHTKKFHFGDIKMTVKKHLLDFNENGTLKDAQVDEHDQTPEGQFALQFTKYYNEIGQYFPEFARLKELVKISGAISDLKQIRAHNNFKIQRNTLVLATTTIWEELHKKIKDEKTKELTALQQGYPEAIRIAHSLTDATWWNNDLNTKISKKSALLQSLISSFPKFSFQLSDSEISKAYNDMYNENYNRIYQTYYDDLYQQNKTSIISKHGVTTWNSHEAQLASDLKKSVSQQVTQLLSQKITKQQVLTDFNNQGSKYREELRQHYSTQFAEIRASQGDTAYSIAIASFMSGNAVQLARLIAQYELANYKKNYTEIINVNIEALSFLKPLLGNDGLNLAVVEMISGKAERLAIALADYSVNQNKDLINKKLKKNLKLERQFQAIQLSTNEESKAESSNDLRIPAVFDKQSTDGTFRLVYGGVSAFPAFNKVSQLSCNLSSPFEFSKKQAIVDAEQYVRECNRHITNLYTTSSSSYWTAQSDLRRLETEIMRAKSDLFWMDIENDRFSFTTQHNFQMSHTHALYNTITELQSMNPTVPMWRTDPFVPYRLEANLHQQMDSLTRLRHSLTSSTETVLQYTRSIFTGAIAGVGDLANLLMHPYEEFLKPVSQLLFDATVIACAHLPESTDAVLDSEFHSVAALRTIIQANPELYELAHSNMVGRVDNIKTGLEAIFQADGPEQAEAAARTAVNFVGPQFILKAAKVMSTVRPKMNGAPMGLFNGGKVNTPLQSSSILGLETGEHAFLASASRIGEGDLMRTLVPPLIAESFVGQRYHQYLLRNDVVLYRAGQQGKPLGQFFAFEKPVGEIQVRMDSALRPVWPQGGTSIVDTGFVVKIPKGTIVHVGEVANQGGVFMGGAKQVYIQNPWLIKGIEILENYSLEEGLLWNQIARKMAK
jgi:curved DNA-binding protein CbpA